MPADIPELSSIASTLEQLSRRVASMAEAADHRGEDDIAAELFSVERDLGGAERKITRMVRKGRESSR